MRGDESVNADSLVIDHVSVTARCATTWGQNRFKL